MASKNPCIYLVAHLNKSDLPVAQPLKEKEDSNIKVSYQ